MSPLIKLQTHQLLLKFCSLYFKLYMKESNKEWSNSFSAVVYFKVLSKVMAFFKTVSQNNSTSISCIPFQNQIPSLYNSLLTLRFLTVLIHPNLF